MPYIESITEAGRTIEIERYYSARYNKKGASHQKKEKPTKEAQKRVNDKQAEKKLRRLINANFGYGDFHLVLDYIRDPRKPDRTADEMRKDAAVFLRECRNQYKKAGKVFKYIHVMEIGQKGSRHHHLVINKIDTEIIQRAWYKAYEGHNRVKVFPLDDSGNYSKLASYLIKYTSQHLQDKDRLQGKRWACSRNLVRPQTKRRVISGRKWFKSEPTPKKGYMVDLESVEKGLTSEEFFGYGYFRYTLVKIE